MFKINAQTLLKARESLTFYLEDYYIFIGTLQTVNNVLMNTHFSILSLFLFIYTVSVAQELPNITAHSPNAASLGQYGEHPVDFSTGVPKIEAPLYTIKSGELQLPITLSYHASGIKVDREASFVGLGWVLNAGGVITRVIKDKDDQLWGDATTNSGFSTRGNILPDYNPIDGEFPAGITGNDPDTFIDGDIRTNYRMDKEPDLYNIQSNKISGEFCLDNTLQYVSTGYEPYKYDVDLNNESIVITDENGDIYRFGRSLDNEEAYETTSTSGSSLDLVNGTTSSNSSSPYNSSWYLTEIISSNRKDTIYFKYKSSYYSDNKVTGMSRYNLTDGLLSYQDAAGKNFNSTIRYYSQTTIANTRVLDKILFKNGSIEFNTATDRLDMSTQGTPQSVPRITDFRILDKDGKQIKKVVLSNNLYFNRTANSVGLTGMPIAANSKRKKSLKLGGVEFYDSNNTFVNDYKFEYDATLLPATNTTSQDFWGYYNGSSSNTFIPESFYTHNPSGRPVYLGGNRTSNFTYMKAGVLNKITFPTAGYTSFEYEPNYYLEEYQQDGQTIKTKSISALAINRLSSCPPDYIDGVPANNTLDFTVTEDVINNGSAYDGTLTVMFSDYVLLNGAQSMSFRLLDITSGTPGSVVHSFQHLPTDKDNYQVFTQGINMIEGHTYRLEANTNGVTGSNMSICDSPWIEATLTYDYYSTTTTQQIIPKEAGGLRIKTISNYDDDNTPLVTKEYTYGDLAYGPNGVGAGVLISDPSNYFYYYPLLYFVNGNSAELKDVLWFTATSQVELGTNNGNPVDYNKVTEYITSHNNNAITNGKTEYYYTPTGRDVDKSYATTNRPYDRYIFPSWKKSNLLKTIYSKQKGDLSYESVRSDEYEFTDLPELRIKTLKIIEREPESYAYYTPFYSINSQNRFYYYNFYQSIGKRVLSKKTTKEYENGIETLVSSANYVYGNTDHMQQTGITMINSQGNTLKTVIEYPQDLGVPTPAEQDLITNHRLALPIKTETFRKEGTNPEEKLSSQYTVYNHLKWTGQNLPEIIKTSKGPNTLKDRIQYHEYYTNGSVKEVSKTDGTHIVYIWGYNKEYPIAKIENATYLQIEAAIATLPSSYNTLEKIQAKSNTDNDRTIGNTGKEGELRTALQAIRDHSSLSNTMVTTYTFDPLIGVTSMTDPRGYTTYYEYDDANRLKHVKDAMGNILSKNEYHYKSQ